MVKVKATKAAKTNEKTGRTSGKTASATVTSARKPTASKFFSVSNLMISACQECNAVIEDDTKALQCEKCEKNCAWICLDCLGLSDEWYDSLKSCSTNAQLHWFCRECEKNVFDKCHDTSEIVEMLKELMSHVNTIDAKLDTKADSEAVAVLDQQLQKVEEKVNQVVETNTVDEAKQNHSEDRVSVDVATVSNCVDEIVRAKLQEDREEEKEIEKRKTSVIIHGLTESQGQTADERIQEDNEQIEELFHKLDLDTVSVDKIVRLGKRPETSDAKPRPVKVSLASEEQKTEVLIKAKNYIRKREGASNGIFIHQDLTPSQRMRRQELVKELKRRQSQGEQNLMIINWKIVERRR